jgi:hypothetical protein
MSTSSTGMAKAPEVAPEQTSARTGRPHSAYELMLADRGTGPDLQRFPGPPSLAVRGVDGSRSIWRGLDAANRD